MRSRLLLTTLVLALGANTAHAQVLIAHLDRYGIPFGEPLVVEPNGVLDNDLLDGEPAGENGAMATLVTDVRHGTLVLNPNGSFTYSPGLTFDGADEFVYQADFEGASAQATASLSACTGGPDFLTCWNESAFLAMATYHGFGQFQEGFEDDVVWGSVRVPFALPSVDSQGIRWQSNHPDPPASNPISTSNGAARTDMWGVYDPNHGYATGIELQCDVDAPADSCLYNDGFTGIRETGLDPLFGVGGYITGSWGAKVAISLDDGVPFGGGLVGGGYQFYGVIDLSGLGFTQFEFRELDGKVGQALFVWGDDFTLLTPVVTAAPPVVDATLVSFAVAAPNPSFGNTTFRFELPARASVRLALYDMRGRLVRELISEDRGPGQHAVAWNGRDNDGRRVSSGVYYGRLVVDDGRVETVLTRRVVVVQ